MILKINNNLKSNDLLQYIMNQTDHNDTTGSVPQKEVKLVDIPVKDEHTALNLMVSFLSIAQKRGAFTFDESAKIWECIRVFQKS
jgi:hypothetical protein